MRAMADSVLASVPGGAGEPAISATPGSWPGSGQATAILDPWTSQGPGAPAAAAEPPVVVLAAADPANAYGAALPWPPRPDETPGGHRPGRKAGALVILVAGQLVLYVERGGKTLLSWTADPALLGPATTALAGAVRAGALGKLTVERADGGGVYESPLARALEEAGFRPTPRGLRLRG
jgi:ATP-dependent Lhr-like helicase